MRVIRSDPDTSNVELTNHELTIINNALNEVCNGPDAIEDWEFATRMGAERREVEALLDDVHGLPDPN